MAKQKIDYFSYINIDESLPDSKSLIMPHQSEAVEAMTNYFQLEKDFENRKGMLVMPTGSGKTYTAVNWLLQQGIVNDYRIIWLVHRQELVDQTYKEFVSQAPKLKGSGVKKLKVLPVSGAHLHMSTACKADVYVCSIASVANQYGYRFIERMLGAAGKRRVIVVVDEAHHFVAANYQKVWKRISKLNPNAVLLGLTATPYRMSPSEQRKLQKDFNIDKNIEKNIGINGYVYEVTLKQLLISGFLAQPYYERVDTEIIADLEYQLTEEDEAYYMQYGELSERLMRQIAKSSARNGIILKQYLDNRKKYGKTIVFAVNQLHAETLCDRFKEAGITCDYAVSSRGDAQEVIRRFKNNEFEVLVNVQILTEGSDVPDIQTVFLTRETNSDSMLMQMIGRGLRGVKAGGTKNAYIVSFHDTWERFSNWLEPGKLDIFEEADTEPVAESSEINLPEVAPPSKADDDEVIISEPTKDVLPIREIYMKLYEAVKIGLKSSTVDFSFPVGWYSLIDEDGNEKSLLVYENQRNSYKAIEQNLPRILDRKFDVYDILAYYFDMCETEPDEEELAFFLTYIDDEKEMPPYYTFDERAKLDPTQIAKLLKEKIDSGEKFNIEEYLKKYYDKYKVLQEIYKTFYAFKKSVLDAQNKLQESIIVSDNDLRAPYEIIENYFDLNELLKEVLEIYPKLNAYKLVRISWSNNCVKRWFALCQRFGEIEEAQYVITINKMLSSPQVNKEVIKYLIFHELLHENGYWNHDMEFRLREWQYPNSAEWDGFLDTLHLEYDTDEVWASAVNDEIPQLYEVRLPENTHENSPIKPAEKEENKENSEDYDKTAEGVVEGFKYCRNCGYKLPATANFCDKCGKPTKY